MVSRKSPLRHGNETMEGGRAGALLLSVLMGSLEWLAQQALDGIHRQNPLCNFWFRNDLWDFLYHSRLEGRWQAGEVLPEFPYFRGECQMPAHV